MNKRYIYLLKTFDDIYKIGVAKNINQRMKQLKTGSANDIILVDSFLSDYPFKVEASLHEKYKRNRVNGEWYYLTEDDVKSFQENCTILENGFKCLNDYNNPYV